MSVYCAARGNTEYSNGILAARGILKRRCCEKRKRCQWVDKSRCPSTLKRMDRLMKLSIDGPSVSRRRPSEVVLPQVLPVYGGDPKAARVSQHFLLGVEREWLWDVGAQLQARRLARSKRLTEPPPSAE